MVFVTGECGYNESNDRVEIYNGFGWRYVATLAV